MNTSSVDKREKIGRIALANSCSSAYVLSIPIERKAGERYMKRRVEKVMQQPDYVKARAGSDRLLACNGSSFEPLMIIS